MARWFAVKKFGRITLVSMLLVCALCTIGESWTPQDYDGQWQVYSPGWSYMWLSSGNYAVWKNDAIGGGRFVYAYTPGQWFDGSWNSIGNNGASSAFIGDGAWHNLNNGWSYDYLYANDYAAWSNTSIGRVRFISAYTPGQWFDGSWNKIGGTGTSMAFLGDGTWHNLNNGWSYDYISAYDYAAWKNNAIGSVRFISAYTQGQWFDGSWNKIGGTGTSMAFIGDGTWHNLNNGWSYDYISAYDYAAWKNNAIGSVRFISAYTQGQWYDGAWNKIGGTGTSMAFLGDGTWHNLNNGWSYAYISAYDYAAWKNNAIGRVRFISAYTQGQWFDGTWNKIGGTGTSMAFLGDGAWHDLSTAWSFYYDASADSSQVKYQGALQFAYNCGLGQWSHYDRIFSTWREISETGTDSTFIGDGGYYDLGDGWTYHFAGYIEEFGSPVAYWENQTGADTLYFAYSTGQWYYYIPGMTPDLNNSLGNAGLSAVFVGDGAPHNLNNGWLFVHDMGMAQFYRNVTGTPLRFSFNCGAEYWFHHDGADSAPLYNGSLGLSWMWDGLTHYAETSYLVAYNYAADEFSFYAKVSGTPSYDNPVSFLKYSYADHMWYDRRALSTATWYIISNSGSTPQILRSYHNGGEVEVSEGVSVLINVSFSGPMQRVEKDAQPLEQWSYTYGNGEWWWYNGTTWSYLTTGDPNQYR